MIEGQLVELARSTGDFATAAGAYAAAIAALADDPHEAARLRLAHGDLLDGNLADDAGALAAFGAAAATQPGNLRAVQGVVRVAPRLGRWDDAAIAVIGYTEARDRNDNALWDALEQAAWEASEDGANPTAFDGLAAAVSSALGAVALSPGVAAEVHHRLARWHRDRRGDRAAAIAELTLTLKAGGDRQEPLAELAEQLRAEPMSASLLDVLRRLADADARALDVLVEAADAASRLGDRAASVELLGQVLGRATAAWRGGTAIQSSRPADAVVRWALDGLVELHRGAGAHRAAVDLLGEAARLPFDDATRRELRLRAAAIAEGELGDVGAAIDTYRGVLAAAPGDLETIAKLGTLLEREGRTAELLGLRKVQLGLEQDAARRLELRLDIARLVGAVEEQGGRLEALEANLADQPGHDASIDAVAAFLAGKGQHKPRADLLEKQAAQVEAAGETPAAPRGCGRATRRSPSRDTHEIERAITGHRRVVALAAHRRLAARAGAALRRSRAAGGGGAVVREPARRGAGRGAPGRGAADGARAHRRRRGGSRDRRDRVAPRRQGARGRAADLARGPLSPGRAVGAAGAAPDPQPVAVR